MDLGQVVVHKIVFTICFDSYLEVFDCLAAELCPFINICLLLCIFVITRKVERGGCRKIPKT